MKIISFLRKYWPVLAIVLLTIIFFNKFFLKLLLPIPGDIVIGLYFPWLDYKWGYVVGVPVKNNIISDVVSMMYPFKNYAVSVLKSGSFPFWNPLSFCGAPLFANFQSNILHPLTLLFWIFPFKYAWSLQVMAQPLLSALFTYLFLRSSKLSRLSSLLGGMIYAFSGFSIIWMEYNVLGYVALFIPLLFYIINNYFKNKNWGFLLSFVVAVQVFSGYPQLTIYSLFFACLYFMFMERKNNFLRKKFIVSFFVFIFYLLLGLGISGFQLIPGYELLKNSARPNERMIDNSNLAFLPMENILVFLIPDFFGNPTTGNFWFKGEYTNNVHYFGLASLVLMLTGIFYSKNSYKKYWIAVFGTVVIYIFPNSVSFLIREGTSYLLGAAAAPRAAVFLNLSGAFLAACGFQKIQETKKGKLNLLWRIPLYFFIATSTIIVELQIILSYLKNNPYIIPAQQEATAMVQNLINQTNVSFKNSILPLLISLFFLLAMIIFVKVRNSKARQLIIVFLFMLVLGELFRFGWKYLSFTNRDLIFPSTPIIEYLLKQEKPFRVSGGNVIPMNMWSFYGLQSAAGWDSLYPLSYGEFLQSLNSGIYRSDSVNRFGHVQNLESKLFDLTNTKYVLSLKYDKYGKPRPEGTIMFEYQKKKFKQIYEDKSVVVLENTLVLPRAFVVYEYQVEKDKRKIMETLLSDNFALKDKIIIEEDDDLLVNKGSVKSLNYNQEINGESRVLVDHDGTGFLFVSDSYYPGWKAFVDGKVAKIYRADYTFRAVYLPKGNHTVKFVYDSVTPKAGLALSIFSLFLLCLLRFLPINKR